MAFSFPGASPAASAGSANAQSGPDLEDIQTEVILAPCTHVCLLFFLTYARRILDGSLSMESLKFNYYLHHGRPIDSLLRLPL
jgi:hypothetical protein